MQPAQNDLLDLALSSRSLQEKLRYCTRYLESDPNNADVWEYKGNISVVLGQNDQANACLEKFGELVEESYFAGWVKFVDAQFKDALGAVNTALDKRPDYVRAWILKGYILVNLESHEQSLQCFDRASELSTTRLQKMNALVGKAEALIRLERFPEAAECGRKVLDIDPVNVDSLKCRGLCLYELRGYQEAVECFLTLLDIDPNNEIAKDTLTLIEMRTGKKIRRNPKR